MIKNLTYLLFIIIFELRKHKIDWCCGFYISQLKSSRIIRPILVVIDEGGVKLLTPENMNNNCYLFQMTSFNNQKQTKRLDDCVFQLRGRLPRNSNQKSSIISFIFHVNHGG